MAFLADTFSGSGVGVVRVVQPSMTSAAMLIQISLQKFGIFFIYISLLCHSGRFCVIEGGNTMSRATTKLNFSP
jgi:hypothetical protein